MQVTITIPRGWGYPRFTFGQRTKQGIVVGIEYLFSSTKESVTVWEYGLLQDKNSKDIIYLPESEIQQLSNLESDSEILAEIDEHLNQVAILQEQLGVALEIKTPFGDIKPKVSVSTSKDISRRSAA